jgi:hypothetical protein
MVLLAFSNFGLNPGATTAVAASTSSRIDRKSLFCPREHYIRFGDIQQQKNRGSVVLKGWFFCPGVTIIF